MNRSKENSLINTYTNNEKLKFISIEELILFLIYNLYFAFNKEYTLYVLINICLYISITIAIAYICLVKVSTLKIFFVEYLGVECIFIVILSIINLFAFKNNIQENSIQYGIIFSSISYCFEFLIISLGLYYTSKKINIIKLSFIYSIILAIALIIFSKINAIKTVDFHTNFNLICILNFIIAIIITGFMILALNKIKGILNKSLTKIIHWYIILRACSYLATIALIFGFTEAIIIAGCLKFCALYFTYKGLANWLISDSIKSMRINLKNAKEEKAELVSKIKKRNNILNDTNIMIEKSQSKYNKLIDSVYDGVFLFSSNKLEYINKTGLELLNYIDKKDILGIELETFIDQHFDFKLEEFNDTEIHITDAKMKCSSIIVELFIVYVDMNNKLIYIHDTTELNKTKIMRNKLEEYLIEEELKNQFFSNVSHELRTPINLIYSAIQLNEVYLKKENIDSIKKNNKVIKQNSLRLIRTINNFIDTNKVSEGYLKPNFNIYNIVEVVENISIACNKYINKAEINLIFDAEYEEIYVKCDKDMIERIILNIISNSVKYGKKGGQIKVDVNITENDILVIKVQNNGCRISEETIPYVFDKFTKINKSLNRLREGSGLGLFLSKALIELQGGDITLISDEKGNLFVITFPIANKNFNNNIDYCTEMNNIEEKVDVEFSDIYIE